MRKNFITYFLAIGIPITFLAVFYINYIVPSVQHSEDEIYIGVSERDMITFKEVYSDIEETISVIGYDAYLSQVKEGEYEEQVYFYNEIIDKVSDMNNKNSSVHTAFFVEKSNRIFSRELGVVLLEEYEHRHAVEDFILNEQSMKSYRTEENIIILNIIPNFYFDSSIILISYIDVEDAFVLDGTDNLVILSPEHDILYSNTEIDISAIQQFDEPNSSIQIDDAVYWYSQEETNGFIFLRIYDASLVNDLVRTTISMTILIFSASIIVISAISFLLAKSQVKPILKLSSQIDKVMSISDNSGVFDNISNCFLAIQSENENIKSMMEKNSETLKDTAIKDLLWGRITPGMTAEQFLASAGMTSQNKSYFAILLEISMDMQGTNYIQTHQTNFIVKEFFEEVISEKYDIFRTVMIEFNQIVVLLGEQTKEVSVYDMEKVVRKAIDNLKDKLDISVRVLIGSKVENATQLSTLLLNMRKQMNSAMNYAKNVIFLDEVDADSSKVSEHLKYLLVTAIKDGNKKIVSEVLNNIYDSEEDNRSDEEKMGLLMVAVYDVITSLKNYPELPSNADLELISIFNLNISPSDKYNRMLDTLLNIADGFRPVSNTQEPSDYIFEAITYIENNIGKDVSLADIAQSVGLSVEHFSRRFKQHTGYTPLSYITNIKISTAKRMLKETGKSVKEISESVGYNDMRSFTRNFKKIENCTPSEYRNKSND